MDNIVSSQALPRTMKAAQVSAYGGYDQITLADLPTPAPSAVRFSCASQPPVSAPGMAGSCRQERLAPAAAADPGR